MSPKATNRKADTKKRRKGQRNRAWKTENFKFREEHMMKPQDLPGILRMKTVRSVASPVMILKIVSTTKAVEAVRNTNENRYMRGITAQP